MVPTAHRVQARRALKVASALLDTTVMVSFTFYVDR